MLKRLEEDLGERPSIYEETARIVFDSKLKVEMMFCLWRIYLKLMEKRYFLII